MNLTVTLQGMDALSLGVGYLAKAALAGLKLGCDGAAGLFVDEAKLLVPVKTGNLRDHIHFFTTVDSENQQQRQVTPVYDVETERSISPVFTGRSSIAPVYVAPRSAGLDPPYARRIEFGFVGTDSLGRHYHQAAQPYMRPAFENKQAEAAQMIRDEVTSALDEKMNSIAMGRH